MILLLNNTTADINSVELLLKSAGYINVISITAKDNWQEQSRIGTILLVLDEPDNALIEACTNTYPGKRLMIISTHNKQNKELQKYYNYNGVCVAMQNLSESILQIAIEHADKKTSSLIEQVDVKNLFNENPIPIFIFNIEDYSFLDVNEAALKKYGYNKDEFMKMSVLDIRPEGEHEKLSNVLKHETYDGYYDYGVWKHKKKSGEEFHAQIIAYTSLFNNQKIRIVMAIDVQKQVEQENEAALLNTMLQQHKKLVDDILTSVNEMLWSCRADDLIIIYVNNAVENIYGYRMDEVIGIKKLFEKDHIHPDDLQIVEDALVKLHTDKHVEVEYRIFDVNGKQKHLMTRAVLKVYKDGRPDYITGTTVDISELQLTREKLIETTNELEDMMNSITDGFLMLDEHWNFTFINKVFEDLYGVNKKDVIGKNYWDYFPKNAEQKFFAEYSNVLNNHTSAHFEEYSQTLQKWVSVNVYPAKKGISVYFTDITEQHELQDKIKQSEINLKTIINNTDEAIWSVDKDIKLLIANNKFTELIHDLINITPQPGDYMLYDEFGDDIKAIYNAAYLQALSGETFYRVEKTTIKNKTHYFDVTFEPITDINGDITGVSCFMNDVTERSTYTDTIEKQNKSLRNIAWLQSHKVRNRVATILGLTSLLDNKHNDVELNKILLGIKAEAAKLDLVIREINAEAQKANL